MGGNKTLKTLFGVTTIAITPDMLTDLRKEDSNIPKDLTYGLLVWKIIPDTPAERYLKFLPQQASTSSTQYFYLF